MAGSAGTPHWRPPESASITIPIATSSISLVSACCTLPGPNQSAWLAVSRAVRTPNRVDRDMSSTSAPWRCSAADDVDQPTGSKIHAIGGCQNRRGRLPFPVRPAMVGGYFRLFQPCMNGCAPSITVSSRSWSSRHYRHSSCKLPMRHGKFGRRPFLRRRSLGDGPGAPRVASDSFVFLRQGRPLAARGLLLTISTCGTTCRRTCATRERCDPSTTWRETCSSI